MELELDEEGVVVVVQGRNEDSGVDGVDGTDSEKDVSGGIDVDEMEKAAEEGAVDGRLFAALRRGDVRR